MLSPTLVYYNSIHSVIHSCQILLKSYCHPLLSTIIQVIGLPSPTLVNYYSSHTVTTLVNYYSSHTVTTLVNYYSSHIVTHSCLLLFNSIQAVMSTIIKVIGLKIKKT